MMMVEQAQPRPPGERSERGTTATSWCAGWWLTLRTKDGVNGASRGQVVLMFAIFLTVMMGALGLSIDVGMAMAQRRSMQNAADAGALAGARIVAKSTAASPLSAQADVEAVVRSNALDAATVGAITCSYVNDSGSSLGGCGAVVPSGATGTRVTVNETHPTYFIQIMPGAPSTVTTSAAAGAKVMRLTAFSDGPFLPCATNTQLVSGGNMDIMVKSGSTWTINQAAVGQDFKIHGPQIEDCKIHPSSYKGIADQGSNAGLSAPGWFHFDTGDKAGPVSQDVQGADGCKAGQVPKDCVMFLPIAVDQGQPLGSSDHRAYVVGFMPFFITEPKKNEHYGKLLDDYIVYGSGQPGQGGWTPSYEGPITIRLTE
jgi:Flp pilus assembly protein TadG